MKLLILFAALLASAPAAGQPSGFQTDITGEIVHVPTGDADLDHAVNICGGHVNHNYSNEEGGASFDKGFDACAGIIKRYRVIEEAKKKAGMEETAKRVAAQTAADLAWLNKYMGKKP